MDEYRLDHLAQVVTWYFEENLSPLSPRQMPQCFSNAWVSRGRGGAPNRTFTTAQLGNSCVSSSPS